MERFVMVTTKHRGVFAGMVNDQEDGPHLTMKQAQMCVYWSNQTQGILGLAHKGPQGGCRVSPPAPAIHIPRRDVTAIIECTAEAQKAWEAQPWN